MRKENSARVVGKVSCQSLWPSKSVGDSCERDPSSQVLNFKLFFLGHAQKNDTLKFGVLSFLY